MDRAAAMRSALRMFLAGNGFPGESMSAVASEAGVATGLVISTLGRHTHGSLRGRAR